MNKSVDVNNLRQVILDTPEQFQEGFKLAAHIRLEGYL
jgi:hypothetical protein